MCLSLMMVILEHLEIYLIYVTKPQQDAWVVVVIVIDEEELMMMILILLLLLRVDCYY